MKTELDRLDQRLKVEIDTRLMYLGVNKAELVCRGFGECDMFSLAFVVTLVKDRSFVCFALLSQSPSSRIYLLYHVGSKISFVAK
jgi:hypothetical protein